MLVVIVLLSSFRCVVFYPPLIVFLLLHHTSYPHPPSLNLFLKSHHRALFFFTLRPELYQLRHCNMTDSERKVEFIVCVGAVAVAVADLWCKKSDLCFCGAFDCLLACFASLQLQNCTFNVVLLDLRVFFYLNLMVMVVVLPFFCFQVLIPLLLPTHK